jgi:hypothetical protein
MRLILHYAPVQPGDAPEAELLRDHDQDVSEGDTVDLPAPLGRLSVAAVTDRGADLGTVHGDRGTLEELINQGWTSSTVDTGVGEHLHEWSSRWKEVEDQYFRAPAEALDAAADLLDDMLRERGIDQADESALVADAPVKARKAAERWRTDRQDVADSELNDAFNEARAAFESIAS